MTESLRPSLGTEAPFVARLKSGESKLGDRCHEIVTGRHTEAEKLVGHHRTYGVYTIIPLPGVAEAIPVKSGHGVVAAGLQVGSKDVFGHRFSRRVESIVPRFRRLHLVRKNLTSDLKS